MAEENWTAPALEVNGGDGRMGYSSEVQGSRMSYVMTRGIYHISISLTLEGQRSVCLWWPRLVCDRPCVYVSVCLYILYIRALYPSSSSRLPSFDRCPLHSDRSPFGTARRVWKDGIKDLKSSTWQAGDLSDEPYEQSIYRGILTLASELPTVIWAETCFRSPLFQIWVPSPCETNG